MGGIRATPDEVIARLARWQHDVVTRIQLLAAGLTSRQIERRVRSGRLHRVFNGVYSVGGGRLTAEAWWMAGVLAAGEGAVLSHESAAGLWGLTDTRLVVPVHVIAPRHRRSRKDLVVHRHRLEPADIRARNRIAVTSPLRTVADLPPALRERAASRGVASRLLAPEDLGGPFFRSDAERRFHSEHAPPLTNATIAGFERDFAWPEQRLIVELDGPHHRLAHEREADERRDAAARAAGWRVARVRTDDA